MKLFILNNEPNKNDTIKLEKNDYHYLVNVRRLAVGEFFPALLPNGEETQVQILSIEHGVLTVKCTPPCPRVNSFENLPPIILFQALPKSDKMDLIVRQAAEGGITEIVPFVSEFSVARFNAAGQKFLRWERIIKEAKQQSGSKIATILRPPFTMNELLNYWNDLKKNGALGLLFHHLGLEHESLHRYLSNNPGTAAVPVAAPVVYVIGPEGGFSDKEVSCFMENGFKPLTIGNTVLRTETAALYCAAAIRILLLERNSWELKQA